MKCSLRVMQYDSFIYWQPELISGLSRLACSVCHLTCILRLVNVAPVGVDSVKDFIVPFLGTGKQATIAAAPDAKGATPGVGATTLLGQSALEAGQGPGLATMLAAAPSPSRPPALQRFLARDACNAA